MTKLQLSAIFIFLSLITEGYGQNRPPKYWIGFTDKLNTPYSVSTPEDFLSPRSLERRSKQGITITKQDLPVDPAYVDSLRALGLSIINISKWMNGVIVQSSDTLLMDTLNKISFVKAPPVIIEPGQKVMVIPLINKFPLCNHKASIDYGSSDTQVKMIYGEYLHLNGYQGKGMLIAILDAGFDNADSISSLKNIYNNHQVIVTRDFVKDGTPFYKTYKHGTSIFSIIGGYLKNTMYGTAIDASFALIRTENVPSEYVIEEYNWVCGAEFADSLGADIISSSLGYSQFDDPSQDHTYQDMDGKTTVASIGADIAFSKGMVVVNSAGNQGNKPWQKITAPSDAFNVITVGAVDADGTIMNFSSRGPSYDGRVKPDVCALGNATVSQSPDGSIKGCTGTSCSTPLISGMTACLWQANPDATNMQVVKAIRQSALQFTHPDSDYGYGIANFEYADHLLKDIVKTDDAKIDQVTVYPNPTNNSFTLEVLRPSDNISQQTAFISFYDMMGRKLHDESRTLTGQLNQLSFENTGWLSSGVCLVRVVIASRSFTLHLLKIR